MNLPVKLLIAYYVNLISLSHAGFFTEYCNLNDALEKGKKYADILYPGILYADSADGKTCLDYASAFPYSVDGSEETSTILSCGHFLTQVKDRDPDCKIYFKSSSGQTYPVVRTINQWTSNPIQSISTISTDFSVYEISSQTACCSSLLVPDQTDAKSIELMTLSCGWHIDLSNTGTIRTDQKPALWSSQFQVDSGILSTVINPDTLLKLSTTNYEEWFFGSSLAITPQTFLHDSGSMWFRENNGGYELWGLTSHTSFVPRFVIDGRRGNSISSHSCSFLYTPYKIESYPIEPSCEKLNYGNFIINLTSHKSRGAFLPPFKR